jgi:gamma-glutamylcyclotransferase (GGCT)/AIG2-like uncharacterized protein YtfP
VYGTLRKGVDNELARYLASVAHRLGDGRVCGRLYHLGSYPGMKLSGDESDQVFGDLYELPDAEAVLPVLDDYERCGEEYERRVITVSLSDGTTTEAWIYVYLGDVSNKPRIVSGDYLRASA